MDRTERGFAVFDEWEVDDPRFEKLCVTESSLAFEGPHCWVQAIRRERTEGDKPVMIQLNTANAKRMRDALSRFIVLAEDGQLTEKEA